MTLELVYWTACLPTAGKAPTGPRQSKPKAEEVLIEEILKAAGLDPLD